MKKLIFILFFTFVSILLFAQEKIGLALSGGGARGLAHIGVLKVIDELDIPIDYIAGTSTGAIVGGLYAMGYSGDEIEEIILDMNWPGILSDKISREDVYIGQKRWKPYTNFFFALNDNFIPRLPKALFAGNKLINKLFDITYPVSHINNFDDLIIPFRCTATDVVTGELKVFSKGAIYEAIRASMSVPTIFQPFQLEDQLFIDGGINANLPVEIVSLMGADYIIGVQTTSNLRNEDELITLIDVLNQTINYKSSENVIESAQLCDLLIKPDLDNISNLDFNKKKEIILLGEEAARTYFSQFNEFYKAVPRQKEEKNEFITEKIKFSKISVKGNKYLSNSKVNEFVGLHINEYYTKKKILKAFKHAFNSELFLIIYPKIEFINGSYILVIKVKEKNRKHLSLNFSYNNNNEFVGGITVELNNYIQRNSKMLFNLQLGNKTEINIDYVKNFGKHWGIYFRIFPHMKEYRLYSYNEDHEKVNSVKSKEIGGNFGIGLYAREAVNAEIYSYTFKTQTYRDIADFEDTEFMSTGIGFKIYHESLDNFIFPMKGAQLFAKITGAKEDFYSDAGYKKFYSKLQILFPFGRNLSIKYQFEYGSYFKKYDIDFDPFYIGGIDSFLGFNDKERSAPIYKINTMALRLRIARQIFTDLHYNVLSLGKSDVWLPEKNLYHAGGIKLGFDTILGPLRIAAAIDEEQKIYYYLSIGYEFDAFEFSRR
jgi:NTE family protein